MWDNFQIQMSPFGYLTFSFQKIPLLFAAKFAKIDPTSIRIEFGQPSAIHDLDFMCQNAAKADELAHILSLNKIEETKEIIKIDKWEITPWDLKDYSEIEQLLLGSCWPQLFFNFYP